MVLTSPDDAADDVVLRNVLFEYLYAHNLFFFFLRSYEFESVNDKKKKKQKHTYYCTAPNPSRVVAVFDHHKHGLIEAFSLTYPELQKTARFMLFSLTICGFFAALVFVGAPFAIAKNKRTNNK